jgi:glycosyltransferase involved in cell wall biosynthesis
LLLIRRLGRAIRAFVPDLVHVHSRRGADIYGGIAAAMAGVPAIATRRVESGEPGFALRWKLRPYANVVAISQAVEAELLAAGVDRGRVVRIPSAVDTARWQPDPAAAARLRRVCGIPDGAPVAVAVAQLIPRKGHATMLAALARLPSRHTDLRLVCFGAGPLRRVLERRIAAAGLGDRVVLAGFRDDLPALLPGADLVVHPARREGLGVAILEAMSAARPVVATAIGGLTDLVRPGVDGLLVARDDADQLAAALTRLLDEPSLAARLGAAARRRVRSCFSVAAMTDAYIASYHRLAVPDIALLRY